MMKRYVPRSPRRAVQDFHFFAASAAGTDGSGREPQIPRSGNLPATPKTPPAPSPRPIPTPQPEPEPEPVGAAALERAMDYLASTDGPNLATGSEAPPMRTRPSAERPRKKSFSRKTNPSPRLAMPRRRRSAPDRGPAPVEARRAVNRASGGRSHHQRHCTLCAHPDRAAIETEFLHWHAPGHIPYDYKVSRSAIFRHAHAVGLFARRNRKLRFALGHLIERVQDVESTADSIVRAIHAFARVNDDGQWIEPPARLIVSSGGVRREAAVSAARRPITVSLDSRSLSNVIDVAREPARPGSLRDGVLSATEARGEAAIDAGLPGTVDRVETDATR